MTKTTSVIEDGIGGGHGSDWPVMLVHNHYKQPGGEEQVFLSEAALLTEYGHKVSLFEETNQRADSMNALTLGAATIWNQGACGRLAAALSVAKPRIVHFHNTFPLISPAAYRTARRSGAAVVQTLHNFRTLCLNGLFFKNGKPCERCLHNTVPWPGVLQRCYRDNPLASTAVATMLTVHRALGTWKNEVDWYVAPSEFARDKFIEGGLPPERFSVKPNFLEKDPGIGEGGGGYAIFAGRLSQEKGLPVLIEAWRCLPPHIKLRIFGQGPLLDWLKTEITGMPSVELLGWQPRQEILAQMKNAAALVFPSECYENGPLSVTEAFATGLPTVASNHGAMSTLIRHRGTGLLFRRGDANNLAAEVQWLIDHEDVRQAMRLEARAEFERQYTRTAHYERLLKIYRLATARRKTL